MITEDYVSYEIVKLLKEKEFDELCFALYNPEEELIQCGVKLSNTQVGRVPGSYSAPTHQMTLKWLREVHRIETHIVLSELNADNSRKYMFDIYSSDINRDFDSVQKEGFNSYEQAVEAALKETLENLI